MLPHRLHLHNFMSYNGAVPVLDFGQFDLACLSGPNGVGKSTLLEAVTWALWGKSRAKSDDDLVHHGSEGMIVSFEFEVEGNQYRIVRKRSKKKKGQGQLEFYLFQNGDWQPQSGTSKSETQEKINQILHLDYETFINSAFLRQGHADEFTVKRPQERKTILAEILGLKKYDELQEIAREKVKISEIEQESLKSMMERFEEEIKDKDKLKKILLEKEEFLAKIEEKVEKKEKEAKQLQEEKSALENQKSFAQSLAQKISEGKKEIFILEQEIGQKKEILGTLASLAERKEEIEEGFKKWEDLKRQDEELYKNFVSRKKLEEEKNNLERKILVAQKEAEGELSKIQGLIEDRKKMIKNKDRLAIEGKKIKEEVAILEEKEKEKENLNEKRQSLKQEQVSGEVKKSQILQIKGEVVENLNLISRAKAQCPLCQQSLTSAHKEEVKNKLENKVKEADNLEKILNERGRIILKEIENISLKTRNLEAILKDKEAKRNLLAKKRQEYAQILAYEKEIKELEQKCEDTKQQIKEGREGEKDSQALAEVQSKLSLVLYDEKEHQRVQAEKMNFEKYHKLKIQYDIAIKQKGLEEKMLKEKENLLSQKKKSQEADIKAQKKIIFDPKKLNKMEKDFAKMNKELKSLQVEMLAAKEEYGANREKVSQIDLKEKEIKDKKEKWQKAQKEASIFEEITEALGKKGVQAMIIESVLPEIEEEASALLDKMTEGRMAVKIFSQKEKKTDGGLQETLDIQIQDGQNMRPYEMFSGGEAFRIDFAIRIALSKLLARRAGAKLQFLVIDEGFGTQDALGREYIVEAINSIKSDFKKILAITHIQELKDAFPVRVEVTKDEKGSHFEVVS